jgi:hypothetical protein
MRSLIRKCQSRIGKQHIFMFAGFFLSLSVIVYFVIFDYVPPGEVLRPPLIVLVPAGLAVIAALCTWEFEIIKPEIHLLLDRMQTRGIVSAMCIILVLLFLMVCVFGIAGYQYMARLAGNGELNAAKCDFTTMVYGQIPCSQVESTLIKLEREVSDLRSKYGVHYVQTHRLYLYPDVKTLQKETVENSEVLGFVSFEDGDPVIYLPVEPVIDPLAGEGGSSTIRHESLHIVYAEILGECKIYRVPYWFHEGMACCEGMDRVCYTSRRVALKLELWRNKAKKTSADILLAMIPPDERIDHDFYLTSFELTRYILATRGTGVPHSILDSIVNGVEFDQAFKAASGISPLCMYHEWCDKYF